ncbi:phosphate propanoyltransferase [Brevibacillus agri]|uniref:phosphate propanoyltransferase n=1 Tax=Brevibacillus agri TaxID=51101 RepID=UPI002E1E18F8|nr:phosphate propanoyltransferase [Brevibacillus agri]MED1653264.1 phosphate propanoyltransferase [Brevibacillus agri]MED1687878.1 phosphate propanoyltransferase [Brevibacillus agri]MED1695350.1 phosphate propanoyltransferase [Brevibacillus agri]MED1696325.1 phosphate propanoyltransferase [Brevibacillus agri]
MNENVIQSIVEEVVSQFSKQPPAEKGIPLAVSARHCHLSRRDLEALFGSGYELTPIKALSQPGQFAAQETVMIAGPRGGIENVRVLGPARNLTQVEVSKTDSIKLGLQPPLRKSGDIKGSSPVTIIGPKGSIYLQEGLIIAQAHVHMSPADAAAFHVSDGEYVRITVESGRALSFENVLIRVSPDYRLEMHLDTDEANAGFIATGATGNLIKYAGLA